MASQGSLGYDQHHRLLIAVNAGSNTVSVFAVFGDRLALRQVLRSGGTFPVSVTVHGNHVYVLNALNGGSVYGYRVHGGKLFPIFGSLRRLGLNPTAMPQFLNTPGQVSFTPNGSKLLVTTKANGNNVDVFFVHRDGRLSSRPVVNHEPGAEPFGIAYDRFGHVVLAEAGPNAVATFVLLRDHRLSLGGARPVPVRAGRRGGHRRRVRGWGRGRAHQDRLGHRGGRGGRSGDSRHLRPSFAVGRGARFRVSRGRFHFGWRFGWRYASPFPRPQPQTGHPGQPPWRVPALSPVYAGLWGRRDAGG